MKKISLKKKIFITVLFLIAIESIADALDPIIVIHTPDKFMLEVIYEHQTFEDKDFTEDMWKYYTSNIEANSFSTWSLNWRFPRYSKFSMRWYPVKEILIPNQFEEGHFYQSYEEIMIDGQSVSEDWSIKYQDIDFCRLDIYVGDDGKIARQEKSGWFCIK